MSAIVTTKLLTHIVDYQLFVFLSCTKLENKDYVAIIECNDSDTSNFYLGIGRPIASNKKFETSETLQKILNDNELSMPEDLWYGWKYTSLENAYSDLKILINYIKSK